MIAIYRGPPGNYIELFRLRFIQGGVRMVEECARVRKRRPKHQLHEDRIGVVVLNDSPGGPDRHDSLFERVPRQMKSV